jgi:hypothetical protein
VVSTALSSQQDVVSRRTIAARRTPATGTVRFMVNLLNLGFPIYNAGYQIPEMIPAIWYPKIPQTSDECQKSILASLLFT